MEGPEMEHGVEIFQKQQAWMELSERRGGVTAMKTEMKDGTQRAEAITEVIP